MASNSQIISDLKVIHEANHSLELLTIYKGVPFICKATILAVEDDLVQVGAKDPSLVCLISDKKPRVLGSDYFEPSIAAVVSMDIKNGKVGLSNFSYIGIKLGERMIVRVEPKEAIAAELQIEGETVAGDIADISINGMGVHIPHAAYTSVLKPGASLVSSFKLPTGDISLSGAVLSALTLRETYRLSVRFTQNGSQKIVIFRYLVDRRAEIEEEMLAEYQAAIR